MKAKQRKEWTESQKKKAGIIIIVASSIVTAFVGFIIGICITAKPMDDKQFKDCEKVAQQIYDQLDHRLIEVPEGYTFTNTQTEIIVRKDNYSGSVKAKLKNGALVFEQNDGNNKKREGGLVIGLIGLVVGLITSAITVCKTGLIKD